jgi:hypothetical protein
MTDIQFLQDKVSYRCSISNKNQLSIKAHSLINASGCDEREITYSRVEDNDLYKVRNHRSSRVSFRNISYLWIVMFKALSYEVDSMY